MTIAVTGHDAAGHFRATPAGGVARDVIDTMTFDAQAMITAIRAYATDVRDAETLLRLTGGPPTSRSSFGFRCQRSCLGACVRDVSVPAGPVCRRSSTLRTGTPPLRAQRWCPASILSIRTVDGKGTAAVGVRAAAGPRLDVGVDELLGLA